MLLTAVYEQAGRRKQEGNRAGRHQVFNGDRLEFSAAARPGPALKRVIRLGMAKSPVDTAGVARSGHRQRLQWPLTQGGLDAGQRDRLVQGVDQRHIVQNRAVQAGLPRQAPGGGKSIQSGPGGDIEPVDIG